MDHKHLRVLKRMTVPIIPLLMLVGCGVASTPAQGVTTPAQGSALATQIPVEIPSPAAAGATPGQVASLATETPVLITKTDDPASAVNPANTPEIPPEETASPVGSPQPLASSEGMVKIEAGDYVLGSTKPDASHVEFLTEATTLATFWIDAYDVTNAEYKAFVDQTGHAPPSAWPGKPKYPVRGVTWDDAAAYCVWAYKRLPSEAEWESAARGPGANPPLYPWGDDPTAGGMTDDLPRTGTYEVGTFPFNRSPTGVYDMTGNVWQWVGDPYGPVSPGMRILRGGRFGLIQDMAFRQQAEPNSERFVPYAGFRCAADQVQGG
jgi:formylglycine-generating enzyme required for sulfatase activity